MTSPLIPVFDIGGVFVDWNPMYLWRKIFDTEDEARWFHDNICTPDWNLEFDAGEAYAEGIAKLIARYPKYWREIRAYDERWTETHSGLFDGTLEIHDELIAAGLKTYAITNFSWEKWTLMLGEWAFLEKFEGVVVSGMEKLVKPDPRIYRLFCERFGLEPHRCVFIDDKFANVHAAEQMGMKGVVFENPGQLRTGLIKLGLPLSASV